MVMVAEADKSQSAGQSEPSKAGFVKVAKTTFSKYMEDNCLNLSAAIAYYALQSIIPLVLGFIAVGSLFLQDADTRKSFIDGIESAIPKEVGDTIKFGELADGLLKGAAAAGLLSIVALLWTGSGIFNQFIFAINIAYNVKKDKRNFFVKLGLRIGMLFGLGGLLALSFAITIIFSLIVNADLNLFGISPKNFSFVLPLVAYLLPLALEVAIFALLYKFSPNRKGVRWSEVFIGGTVAAVLFEILKIAFGFYITAFGAADNAAKTYGAIGGIIVFLFFLYLAAAVVLFGAEVSAALYTLRNGLVPATEAQVKSASADQPTPVVYQSVPPAKPSSLTVAMGGFVLLAVALSGFSRKR